MKLRIKFEKSGIMKFIGHLDTQRYFQKLLRRSDIPVAYTEGYSPHQKLSFAQPLGVGVESRGEYFDIEIKDDMASELTSDSVIKRLNETTVEGIKVTECVRLKDDAKNAMASVFAAAYELKPNSSHTCPFDMDEAIEAFNNAESVSIIKETKKTSRRLELKELVYELKKDGDSIFIKLNAASGSSVKPMLVLDHIYEKRGFEMPQFAYHITRLEIYDEGFRPLIKAGERF